jgi:hypothetical protein
MKENDMRAKSTKTVKQYVIKINGKFVCKKIGFDRNGDCCDKITFVKTKKAATYFNDFRLVSDLALQAKKAEMKVEVFKVQKTIVTTEEVTKENI